MTLALGLFSFAGAKEINSTTHVSEIATMDAMQALADIDPVVRRAVLKQCSNQWQITFVDLESAYAKGDLTIEENMYGSDLAYDVTFGASVICVLESDL
jgi:hypothetical protein